MALIEPKKSERRVLCVVSHTHWDREWYLPYQSFRVRLVGLFDQLIDLFDEDPDYKHFLLDGHTLPIEDYLEIRPDRFDDVERIVQSGKLQIGPWYIIPDEALPGGEAHVRNFLRGHRVAKMFGPVMKVGYIPDPFGQIAHMPAILNGFGITDATMWRGTDDSLKTTEFFWRSPDGSEVLAIHKPYGYGNAATLPRSRRALVSRFQKIRDDLEPLATTPYLLVMNGSDHLPPQPELSSMLRDINEEMTDADTEHVALPEIFRRVREYISDRKEEWPSHVGEFRSGQRAHLLPGVLSARMWIKQSNQACEDLLAHWAEPFSAWMDMLRKQVPPEWKEPLPPTTGHMPFPTSEESIAGLVDRAWRYLLENQPHDSICGCSVDGVHEEMRQRYLWVQQVGEEIVRQALRAIAALAPGDPLGTIAVFNPTPQPATGFVTAIVPWSDHQPFTGVIDPDGTTIQASRIGEVQQFQIPDGAPAGYDNARAEIGFVAKDVPGYGYKVYKLSTATETGIPLAASPEATPSSAKTDVTSSDTPQRSPAIANLAYVVQANPTDGTLTLDDLRTGVTYFGLNRFVSGGDKGDEYNYCVPESDSIVRQPSSPPTIRIEYLHGVRRMIIASTYDLPARISDDRTSRSTETVEERITSTVTLTEGVARIDVHTVVENAADDHRLRVHFPSGITTTVSKADQHFGVIQRPIALPEWDPATWMEQPLGTYPQKAFVSVDGSFSPDEKVYGLTIANRGLPEYEVLDIEDPPGATVTRGAEIAVTLIRAVGWLSRADLSSRKGGAGPQLATPGAQMPGRWEFDYSIIPHAGDWAAAEAHVAAVQHLRPMRARWNRHGLGHIDWEGALVEVSSTAFAVSAIKRAEDGDGIIVRLYNTLDEPAETTVDVPLTKGTVSRVNLNEEHIEDLARDDDGVTIEARQNEIVTLRFRKE